jgi:NitT/TauT family transport system substrate-binding protein
MSAVPVAPATRGRQSARRRPRLAGWAVGAAALLTTVGAEAAPDKVKVGVLKLTSSAPLFVGIEKGFFKEFGVEPELVFFQAAAPIATALAAGQLDVGATGLTAALYNIVLGGEKIWIVADKGRDWPGYPLNAVVVQTELHATGLTAIEGLRGRRIGVTQLGSTFHYQIGNILAQHGLGLGEVKIVPLQTMGAALEALKGKQVDAIILPQPFPGRAEAGGFGKIIAWAGDLFPWQIATLFYSRRFAADRGRALAFMKGYVRASRYYHDAVLVQKDGRIQPGAHYDEVVAITAEYTGAPPAIITLGFPYQDRDGRLLVNDIDRQMAWWVRQGFMKAAIPLKEIVDSSFVEAAVQQLKE